MGRTSPPRPRPAVVRDLAGRGHHVEQPAPPGRNRDPPLPHPVQGRLCQPRAGPGGPAATETDRPGRSAPGAAGPAFPQPPGACLPVPLRLLALDPQAPVPRGGGPLVVGLRLWWTSAPWPARNQCQLGPWARLVGPGTSQPRVRGVGPDVHAPPGDRLELAPGAGRPPQGFTGDKSQLRAGPGCREAANTVRRTTGRPLPRASGPEVRALRRGCHRMREIGAGAASAGPRRPSPTTSTTSE